MRQSMATRTTRRRGSWAAGQMAVSGDGLGAAFMALSAHFMTSTRLDDF